MFCQNGLTDLRSSVFTITFEMVIGYGPHGGEGRRKMGTQIIIAVIFVSAMAALNQFVKYAVRKMMQRP